MASISHIGYGYWGKNLARNFSNLGHLHSIVDPDPSAATSAAAHLRVPAVILAEALSDPAIDAISIASPAGMHHMHARAALEAGKHVYVEKPLALNVRDAQYLCDLAQERGLTLMVGHLLQFHPLYARLREMVYNNELGRLLYVHANRLSLGKFRSEENVLWSFAPHDISMILGLFGSMPVHVSAQGNVAFTSGIADVVTMQMHFPCGGSAHVLASWMNPFKEHKLVVVGDRAMAVFEDSELDWNCKLKLYRDNVDNDGPVPLPRAAEAENIIVPRQEPLEAECRHFADCIDRGLTPLTDGLEGLRVLSVLGKAEAALSQNLQHQGSMNGTSRKC